MSANIEKEVGDLKEQFIDGINGDMMNEIIRQLTVIKSDEIKSVKLS